MGTNNILSGIAGGGLVGLGSSFLKSNEQTNPYGALNPEQVALTKALGNRYSSILSNGPQTYTGKLTEDITPEEQAIVDRSNRLAALQSGTLNDLSTYNDQNFNSQFDTEITKPSYDTFKTYTQPLLEESLPTFSTARANVVGRELSNLNNQLLTQRSSLREAAKTRALNAIQGTPTYEAGMVSVAAVPRAIKQAGLDKEYTNFIDSNQQYSNSLSQMLNFLGLSTGTYSPDTNWNKMMDVLNLGANAAKTAVAAGA